MKCPVCVELGLTSQLGMNTVGFTTDVAYEDYFDEEGKLHSHDPNVFSHSARCSNDHNLHIWRYQLCPNCDYNKGRSYIVYYADVYKKTPLATYRAQDDGWVKEEAAVNGN